MEEALETIRRIAVDGGKFTSIVAYLREEKPVPATPFNLIRVLWEGLGADLHQARGMMEMYDASLSPIVSSDEIDQAGEKLLSAYRENGTASRRWSWRDRS
ncbi:hypothetical protein G3260_003955 [Streptomyces albus]|uniref:hypothetical protein n=1 Tax=Streptomyces albus TaxID=1888 RepID=UPI000A67836D|nr:hypothetical protein [Streptomyces albus]MDI6413519.1 hypothetical protein [Streptomyces albus]QID37503.1 hypothetical protein G3260_003955 [Streptomyces albus]UVN55561.1 hypothetical protein NR995_14250 [Streptomyces albus]GHJ23451.1 hypothetical protein TPA0909_50650 [Streptomyces albus]